jgi:hypothetical protein
MKTHALQNQIQCHILTLCKWVINQMEAITNSQLLQLVLKLCVLKYFLMCIYLECAQEH